MTNATAATTDSSLKTMAPATLSGSDISRLVDNAECLDLDYYHTRANRFLGSPNEVECEGCLSISPELESDDFDLESPNRVAGALYEKFGDVMDYKYDGSLHDGLEIASQPATLAYHMKKFGWADVLKILSSYSKSHDAGTCGFHVHVSRKGLGHTDETRELVIAKLLYLVDEWFTPSGPLGKFSRRDMTDGDQTYWCKPNKVGIKSTDSRKDFDKKYADYKMSYEGRDRYRALNLTNSATIEFRMFRGTHNPETFAATLQLVDCMVKFCKTHTTAEIQSCKFGDIVATCKYAELASYCTRRGISLSRSRNTRSAR